jgi:DNA-binding MarR family transcriptional regulator
VTQFSAVSSAALDDERLNGNDILVLAALGYHTDKNGWCYPSQEKLATKARLSRQSVSTSMKRLVRFGYVERYIPENGNLAKISYRRILDTARAPQAEDTQPAALVAVVDKGGVADADKPLSPEPTSLVASTDKACRPRRHKQEPLNQSTEPDDALPGIFEEIWGVWSKRLRDDKSPPRGDGKAKTYELFRRKCAKADPHAVRAAALQRVKTASRGYLEGLSVWLNKERYDTGAPVSASSPAAELTREQKLFAFESFGRWDVSWGPRPDATKQPVGSLFP